MTVSAQKAPDLASDQRADERIKLRLEGKLFVPAEEITFDCLIVNLSAGGAGIYCAEPPPLNTFVVLYVNGFGRFEGVATRYIKGELGLRFVCKPAKRKRLEEDLNSYVKEGMLGITRLRRFHRSPPRAPIDHFTRTDGKVVPCELIDISLQGVSLRTKVHPPIGEIIELGATKGWVIRHFDDCIGVQFLQRPLSGDSSGG
jgi:PilZ domain